MSDATLLRLAHAAALVGESADELYDRECARAAHGAPAWIVSPSAPLFPVSLSLEDAIDRVFRA